jgi:prefoldin subunit 5
MELSRAGEEIARMAPALEKLQRKAPCLNQLQQKMQSSQRKLLQRSEKIRHELSGEWAEI